jgi:hypothetical protein
VITGQSLSKIFERIMDMGTQEQPTCSEGLAENSILPAKLSNLLTAMAENLAIHMKAPDLTDQNSRTEYEAHEDLVKEFQQIAAQLEATAKRIAGYRDLPMGRHDDKAMTHPNIQMIFQSFVKQKRDNKLLEMMHTHSR